ncbi:hypothetical protein Btru_055906 [Bulinus truncatus]|nr:hypothetical protein Btru_055906 [Bulinus truncatus]
MWSSLTSAWTPILYTALRSETNWQKTVETHIISITPWGGHIINAGAWGILTSFICYFLIGVSGQALSVLFLELVVQYKASLTVTSLTMMIQILFLSISSVIVVSVLLPKFGERKVTVVAGVIFAGCSVGCSLAPDIVVFIIFCAIQGLSIGAVLVPVIGILNFYFDRRLSLAMSISSSGLCVSTIVSPPFIRALMETYGLRGTFLFLAGLELNMVVAGMLLRPLSCYRTKNQLEKKLLNEKEYDEKHDAGIKHDSISSRAETDQSDRSAYSKITNQNPATLDGANDVTVAARDNNKGSADVANDVTAEARSADVANDQNGSKHLPTSNKRLIKERPALRRMNSVVGGVEAAESAIDDSLLEKAREKENADAGQCGSCCCFRIVKEIFNPELFAQWAFLLFLATCIPGATNQYLFQYIPTIAVFQGATKDEGATILTVCGFTDLISRILTGLLADTHILRPTQIVAISLICLGKLDFHFGQVIYATCLRIGAASYPHMMYPNVM